MQAKPNRATNLPPADAASLQHSRRVTEMMRQEIAGSGGSISFAEYMHHALYAPKLGYYAAGSVKFGAAGDFVTAPEVSPLFAFVLARQCAEILQQLDGGDVLELGAGSGILAAGLLCKLEQLGELPDRYLILEISADLRQRQQRLLQEQAPLLADKVEWLTSLPQDFCGVIVANEVADALPVERFAIADDQVLQQRVTVQDDGFGWCSAAAPALLRDAVREIEDDIGEPLPAGYKSEVSLAMPAWIGDIADCLRHGCAFIFDYGVSRREYYAMDRNDGWLRCHFRHFAHSDPLILTGIQDLTTWVDFTAVAAAAAGRSLEVDGFLTQADFLISGGMQEELTDFTDMSERQQIQLSRELKLLTLPSEMGESFKCLGLSRGKLQKASAFSGADRAHRL